MDKQKASNILKTMYEIRKFEEAALGMFEKNELRGSVHLYIGEEAIAATICENLDEADYIASTHRGHGHCIAKGAELGKTMAELMGKETGYCRGRGGSMHIADLTKGNLGANAIVGGGIPIAVGGALAAKVKSTNQVSVAFFGDGASNQGTFHESLNLASVWKLPVIFVCENNHYGISVSTKESTSVEKIGDRAVAYNMPGYTIDGNNVLEIEKTFNEALERARNGEGPSLIECVTYRWEGHWTGDPQVYRKRSEVNKWKEKCPIMKFSEYLVKSNVLSMEEISAIEEKADIDVKEAVEFAKSSPEPDPATVMDDVFAS